MSFRDHFSAQAGDYARYRPTYPDALYAWLALTAPSKRLALDCATGSGQAAVALSRRFERVLGTDASPEQLGRAAAHARVHYAVAYAETAPARAGSVDLVTAATAIHWFDFKRFYDDVRRILRPGGVLAAWSYCFFESEPAIDGVMERYASDILRDDWPERMHFNEERYEGLPFPFEPIETPAFAMEADWALAQLVGFMSTWSAPPRYEQRTGTDPLDLVADDLQRAWGDPERVVHIRWPLHIRVGRNS